MPFIKDKIKKFFDAKTDKAVQRIEKTQTQKLIVSVLVLFSVGTVLLGYLQFKTFLDKPFFADRLVEDKSKIRGPIEFYQYLLEQNKNQDDLVSLQKRDSDLDGLSDYQEIYIYHTNAYSADSDGDGVSDKDEIAKGTDPLCAPDDKACSSKSTTATSTVDQSKTPDANQLQLEQALSQAALLNSQANAQTNTPVNDTNASANTSGQLDTQSFSQLTQEQKDQIKNYFNNLQPVDLRRLLVQQGFPQEQIDALSDDQLKATMQQLLDNLK